MRILKKAFSKLFSVVKNVFDYVFELEEDVKPPHPDKYPDAEILNYPFKRDHKNKIIAKTNYEFEAWSRINKIQATLLKKSEGFRKEFAQNREDYKLGLRSNFTENIKIAYDANLQKIQETIENFELSKETNLRKIKTVGSVDYNKQREISRQQFNKSLISMGILPAENNPLSLTFIENQNSIWATPKQLKTAGIVFGNGPNDFD